MPLDRFVAPWTGTVYRHLPEQSPYGVLDFRFAALAFENRWNLPGQPTLSCAVDRSVAIAEYARHFRAPGVWAELSLTNAPYCFTDRELARAIAGYIRAATPAQALLVPSLAFLDNLTRWSLVVFLEKLPAEPAGWASAEPVEAFRIE